MSHDTLFWHPQEVIGKRWREDQPPEQARILGLARDALRFISATGLHYPFEDFRKTLQSPPAGATPTEYGDSGAPEQPPTGSSTLGKRLHETKIFFLRLHDEPDSAGEEELIQVILDALHFISSTGRYDDFGRYLEHVEAGAPPHAVAAFNTKQEAEAWLDKHPNPPCFANVLIGNDYHTVIYNRETNLRRLPKNESINYHLADLAEEASPVATASFSNLEEAEAWLKAQPNPARQTWVTIASELYLAAYHPNIDHRALYPLSLAKDYAEET
jgi:hypothetical protein